MITPNQIREKKISTVQGEGYDRNEVNDLLVEVIESYEAVCNENKELYRKMEILAAKIEEYREDEDSIKTAIISAQKTAHMIKNEAEEKAGKTISDSNAAAQQTVKDAREKAQNQEIAAGLKNESKEFRATLVSLYETQLEKLKKLASASNDADAADLESELDALVSGIEDADAAVAVQEDNQPAEEETAAAQDVAPQEQSETDEAAVTDEAKEAEEAEEIEEISIPADDEPQGDDDEIDEIISEIENVTAAADEDGGETEEDTEDDAPTEEEVADAINAFTENEITPVEGTGATIPVIEEEPEFESSMPFESFFNVDKGGYTNETISLTAPDEDDDDDDGGNTRFKGFFKRKNK